MLWWHSRFCWWGSLLRPGGAVLYLAGEAGGQRHANQPGYVIHIQLFHHGLTVTAYRLDTQTQHDGYLFAGLALDDHSQHLKFPRRELRKQRMAACGLGFFATADPR